MYRLFSHHRVHCHLPRRQFSIFLFCIPSSQLQKNWREYWHVCNDELCVDHNQHHSFHCSIERWYTHWRTKSEDGARLSNSVWWHWVEWMEAEHGNWCTSASFHAILIKNLPLESRGQKSSVFGIVDKEDNIGNDMSKLVEIIIFFKFIITSVISHEDYPKDTWLS